MSRKQLCKKGQQVGGRRVNISDGLFFLNHFVIHDSGATLAQFKQKHPSGKINFFPRTVCVSPSVCFSNRNQGKVLSFWTTFCFFRGSHHVFISISFSEFTLLSHSIRKYLIDHNVQEAVHHHVHKPVLCLVEKLKW